MGRPITTVGDKTTGHGPWLPRPSVQGSGNVFINGKPVVRVGDEWAPHNGVPNGPHKTEPGFTSSGSGTVSANGMAIARIGDAVEADTIAAGSTNVFAG